MFLFFLLPKNLVWQPALSASVCPCISWNSSLYTRPPFELVLAPYMYVSLRGLFVICKCTCANCVVLPGTVLPIPEDYCLCKCAYVCVRAWITAAVSSYLSVLMTEHQCISRSSYPLGLHPDRHMSNNAWLESNNTMKSRTCTHEWEKHTGDAVLIETRTGWTEFITLSSITIKYDWELVLPSRSTNEASPMSLK